MTDSEILIRPPHGEDDFDPYKNIFHMVMAVYVLALLVFGLVVYHHATYSGELGLYEMSDGTRCQILFISTSIIGADTYIYKNCDNNATYTNPSYVKQLEVIDND